MIDNIITAYLQHNKRLVVPDFGAFIHKDDGEVVFVEFLKKDDQVLSTLIRKEYSMDEAETRNVIEEYVLNIRRTVGATGKYVIEGIGSLHTDANGLYALVYNPLARKEAAQTHHATADEQTPAPEEPVMRVVTIEREEEELVPPSVSDDIIMAVRNDDREEITVREVKSANTIEFAFPQREPAAPEPPKREEKKTFTLNDLYSIPAKEQQEELFGNEPARPSHPERPVQREEPRPQAHSAARQHPLPGSERMRQEQAPQRPERQPSHAPRQQGRPVNYRKRGRSKADWVMIVAIAVAVFALGTMIYGMFIKNDPDIKPTKPLIENVDENTEIIDADTDTEGAENEG